MVSGEEEATQREEEFVKAFEAHACTCEYLHNPLDGRLYAVSAGKYRYSDRCGELIAARSPSLVLVHSDNQRRDQGEHMVEARVHASVSRCRPIILTSITTFVGLSPLMLNTSVQAQFLVPMAVSLAFGVLFATLVTLLAVPAGYLILHDLGQLFTSGEKEDTEADLAADTTG